MGNRDSSSIAKTVVITGGARGIGQATARLLSERGARVAIGDIDEVAAKEAAGGLAGPSHVGRLDVTDRSSFAAFLDEAEAELGPVDVLINNAGIMPVGPFHLETDETARRQMAINVDGVLLGCKLALDRMLPRGRGHIINIASAAGFISAPGIATYCGTKHFVVGLTAGIRAEYAGTGVDFTAVCPGVVRTELTAGLEARRGPATLAPEEVAAGIARAIVKPKPEVFVPGWGAIASRAAKALPPRFVDWALAKGGADTGFLHTDDAERAAYVARTTPAQTESHGSVPGRAQGLSQGPTPERS